MGSKVFVASLSYDATEDQLREHMAQAGTVLSAKVILDKVTGKSRGFGFVEYETPEAAKEAISQLNGTQIVGRAIVVTMAKDREERR